MKVWHVTMHLCDDGFEDFEKRKVRYLTKKQILNAAKKGDFPAGVQRYWVTATQIHGPQIKRKPS